MNHKTYFLQAIFLLLNFYDVCQANSNLKWATKVSVFKNFFFVMPHAIYFRFIIHRCERLSYKRNCKVITAVNYEEHIHHFFFSHVQSLRCSQWTILLCVFKLIKPMSTEHMRTHSHFSPTWPHSPWGTRPPVPPPLRPRTPPAPVSLCPTSTRTSLVMNLMLKLVICTEHLRMDWWVTPINSETKMFNKSP